MQQDNMDDTEPVNPLYDMNSVPEVQKGDLMMSSGSSNPMYDFLSSEGTNGHADSNDLLGLDSSNQNDALLSEENQVNGSIEKDACANQSGELEGLDQNGGQVIEDFDPFGGNVETTPVVDELSTKNESIEELEQESGSFEQEGGSSTSGELLVDSDVPNTRLVPEEDIQGETTEPKESEDLLGGAVEPQESEDLLGGAMEPQQTDEIKVEDPVEETVEQEEQLLAETGAPVEVEPPMTEFKDQGESLMDQGNPEAEEALGDFSQTAEATEQVEAPEEDQEIVDVQQEDLVEVQQSEDNISAPPPQPEEEEEELTTEEASQQIVQGWCGWDIGVFLKRTCKSTSICGFV